MGILFVLKSAIPQEIVPQEMGCGSSAMTCSLGASYSEWHTRPACGKNACTGRRS